MRSNRQVGSRVALQGASHSEVCVSGIDLAVHLSPASATDKSSSFLRASNVTLPERPVWNESFIMTDSDENSEDDHALAPILEGGWGHSMGNANPYDKLMQEYGEQYQSI